MSKNPLAPPIWILILATATSPLALNIFVPSMPGLVEVFETDYATVQLSLTLYLATVGVAQLAYGPISDRFGRRIPLIAGLVIYILASLACMMAWSIESLIVGRALQAIGGCAGMVLGRAIVRDVYGRDRAASALALVTMAMAVAPAMAPAIGGMVDTHFGWQGSFAVPTAMGVVLLIGCVLQLKETNVTPALSIDLPGMLSNYASLLRSRAYIGYAGHTAMSVGAFFSFIAGAPYVMINVLDRQPEEYGFYFVLISGGYMTGNFLASRLSVRLGIDRMIPFGVAISLAGAVGGFALAMNGVVTPASVFVPMCVIAIGNGLSQPNGMAGAISVNPRIAGAASGLMGFVQMIAGAILTVVVGHFQNDVDQSAMAAMILFATVCSALFFALAKTGERTM